MHSQAPCEFLKTSLKGVLGLRTVILLALVSHCFPSSSECSLIFINTLQKLFPGNIIALNKQNILRCYLERNQILNIDWISSDTMKTVSQFRHLEWADRGVYQRKYLKLSKLSAVTKIFENTVWYTNSTQSSTVYLTEKKTIKLLCLEQKSFKIFYLFFLRNMSVILGIYQIIQECNLPCILLHKAFLHITAFKFCMSLEQSLGGSVG